MKPFERKQNLLQFRSGCVHHLHIAISIKFPLQSLVIHISHIAKNRPFSPGAVMFSKAPGHTSKTIRISAIQLILIIQVKSISKGLFRGPCPFQNLLPPIHPHIAMHLSLNNHLLLSSIPVRIMSFGALKFFKGIEILASVFFVGFQCLLRPIRNGLKRIIFLIIEYKIHANYGIRQADGTYKAFDFDPDKALAGKLVSFYKPEFFTRADTGIKTLADTKGHSFCFTSAGSTSGGIITRAIFQSMGINPDTDFNGPGIYAGGHDKAAISVYDSTCDAGVAFMDILTDKPTNLQAKFPDIATKVQVFAVGDRIPNDGLQFVHGFDPTKEKLTVDALMAMMADPAGNAVVYSIYAYNGFEPANFDKYYGPFQDLLKKAGVDVSKLVKQ